MALYNKCQVETPDSTGTKVNEAEELCRNKVRPFQFQIASS